MEYIRLDRIDARLLRKQQDDLADLVQNADINPFYHSSLEGVLGLLGAIADQLVMPTKVAVNDPKNYKVKK